MGFVHLITTCGLMFVGPIMCGLLALLFTKVTSGEVADGAAWWEALAAGVMLGSAFAVVLPEGFEALFTALALQCDEDDANTLVEAVRRTPDESLERSDSITTALHQQDRHVQKSRYSFHSGLAILAGFFTMLIFEMWHDSHGGDDPEDLSTALQEQGNGLLDTGSKEMPVLLGLILHAAADGLAVGVACISPSVKLAAAVSMAMVLHKGPVAFGLGVFLASQDLRTYRIVRDIILFASSSPVAAVVTYMVLAQVPVFRSRLFVALAVLYSAGTFVYAACVHMLPHNLTPLSLIPVIGGALIPCTLNLLGNHEHH